MEESAIKHKACRNRIQQVLSEDTETLANDIYLLGQQVDRFRTFYDESKVDEYYRKVREIQELIDTYNERIILYNKRESLFLIPPTSYSSLKDITKSFEPYKEMWTITYEYSQQFPQWHEGMFQSLDSDSIDANVAKWSQKLAKLKKLMKNEAPVTVVESVTEKLDAFRPNIPLIAALRNAGLRDRHWKKISTLSGKPLKITEEITFNELLRQNLQEQLEEIQEVSEYASKEYRLEKQMEKMQNGWKTVQFELAPYSDTYIIKSVDDIQQLLDDHIIKTQTMLGSPLLALFPFLSPSLLLPLFQIIPLSPPTPLWLPLLYPCSYSYPCPQPIPASTPTLSPPLPLSPRPDPCLSKRLRGRSSSGRCACCGCRAHWTSG